MLWKYIRFFCLVSLALAVLRLIKKSKTKEPDTTQHDATPRTITILKSLDTV